MAASLSAKTLDAVDPGETWPGLRRDAAFPGRPRAG